MDCSNLDAIVDRTAFSHHVRLPKPTSRPCQLMFRQSVSLDRRMASRFGDSPRRQTTGIETTSGRKKEVSMDLSSILKALPADSLQPGVAPQTAAEGLLFEKEIDPKLDGLQTYYEHRVPAPMKLTFPGRYSAGPGATWVNIGGEPNDKLVDQGLGLEVNRMRLFIVVYGWGQRADGSFYWMPVGFRPNWFTPDGHYWFLRTDPPRGPHHGGYTNFELRYPALPHPNGYTAYRVSLLVYDDDRANNLSHTQEPARIRVDS